MPATHDLSALKLLAFWGGLVMIAMTFLTVIFQEDRMFFLDPDWMLYIMTVKESVVVQEMRYGSFITHLFPVLGMKSGASLSQIQFLYNISFFTFFTSVYAFLYIKFKQYDLCVLLLAYFTLFVGDVFFWPNNEVHQGVAWSFMALGYYYFSISRKRFSIWAITGIPIMLFLGISSHLLVAIPVLYIWLFKSLVVHKGNLSAFRKKDWIGTGCILLMVGVKYILSNLGGYDNLKLAPVRHIKIKTALNSFISPHANDFYALLLNWHFYVLLTVITGMLLLLRQKSKWYLSLYITTILGSWILLNLIYPYPMPRNLWFYMESEYQVLGIVLLSPLVYLYRGLQSGPQLLKYYALGLLLVVGVKIGIAYQYFHNRLNNLKAIVSYCEGNHVSKGVLVMPEQDRKDYFIMDWGIPVETLTLSLLKGTTPVSVKIISKNDMWMLQSVNGNTSKFLSCFSIDSIQGMNAKYFQLDTTTTYKQLPSKAILPLLKKLN